MFATDIVLDNNLIIISNTYYLFNVKYNNFKYYIYSNL